MYGRAIYVVCNLDFMAYFFNLNLRVQQYEKKVAGALWVSPVLAQSRTIQIPNDVLAGVAGP